MPADAVRPVPRNVVPAFSAWRGGWCGGVERAQRGAAGDYAMLCSHWATARLLLDTLAHLSHLPGGEARPHPSPQESA